MMNWEDLKNDIYYWDGSFRDIYISRISCLDWQKWIQYVNMNYRIEWFNPKNNTYESIIDFKIIENFWHGSIDICPTASIFIDKIRINVHFFEDTQIENDIDPRQINSLEDNAIIIKYMLDISNILNKEVLLTPENEHAIALIKVNKNDTKYTWGLLNISDKSDCKTI